MNKIKGDIMKNGSNSRRLIVWSSILAVFFVLIFQKVNYAQEEETITIIEVQKNAAFVDELAPTMMNAGQTYKVSITMRNTGTFTWNDPNLDQTPELYELRSIPMNRTDPIWGINSVPVNTPVLSNETYTFSFEVRAPDVPGTYEFKWQMAAGGQLFGESSPSIAVNVVKGSGDQLGATYNLDNKADVVNMTVPLTMDAGGNYKASVVMKNSGQTTWQPGFFWLEYQDPTANATYNPVWGTTKIALDKEVKPGENAVFEFDVKAPMDGGSYLFNWMMGNAAGTFGPSTSNVYVNVAGKSSTGGNDAVK